ncbi:hypothetical protein BpHYR1_007187 [Brachionus plicatilis]|uniref:Uncharacterized protein n=1 Tax=Brachionus plicatilis TaxID=10195 RepID=A0A3M7QXG3_BRAPC|nr:hypothetical protein BpHYR1_007187 [Brachionus plicatilis]
MFKFRFLILFNLFFLNSFANESKILNALCKWHQVSIQCTLKEYFLSNGSDKFEQKTQIIFDSVNNFNLFGHQFINLEITDSVSLTNIEIIFSIHNIEFSRPPRFYLPHLKIVYLKSVYFKAKNNSMLGLKCKSTNFKSTFVVNPNISVYSNGEKCSNSNCNQCDLTASQEVSLEKRSGLFEYDRNSMQSEILNIFNEYFSNDFLIFFAKLKNQDSRWKENDNSRPSVDSIGSVQRRSMQRHQFAVENLKKRPSKSILITPERKSQILENRLSTLNKLGLEQNRESVLSQNRLSVLDPRQSQASDLAFRNSVASQITRESSAFRLSNFNVDDNRKSMSSLKSVTFNEKTQKQKYRHKILLL